MNIFLISRGIPTKREPQWGCFEYDQAMALSKLGHKVVYLCVDSRFRRYYRPCGISKEIRKSVITYNIFVLPHVIAKLFGNKLAYKFRLWQLEYIFKKAVQEEGQPDILYSHYLAITHEAISLKQKYHIPLVAIEHWSEVQRPTLSKIIQQQSESYKYVDKLIAVSYALKKALTERFEVDSVVVHNMVGDEFSYHSHNLQNRFYLVSTGSLRAIKGFEVLINALAQIQIPKNNWHLTIIGNGEERDVLSALITQLKLTDNISLVGAKSKQEIASTYNKCDVFVLPSRSETFGVAYIEAMACGLPVIATRCGGPEEFVNEKNGLLVPIDDVDALATAIQYMYRNHRNYDRQAIAKDCKARFSSEIVAQRLTEIFEDVIKSYNQ